MPEELNDADGELVWQACYKVWGNAVQEVMPTSVHVSRPRD
ncbi:RHS domain-containing protein [Burkholderia cepacia]